MGALLLINKRTPACNQSLCGMYASVCMQIKDTQAINIHEYSEVQLSELMGCHFNGTWSQSIHMNIRSTKNYCNFYANKETELSFMYEYYFTTNCFTVMSSENVESQTLKASLYPL